jgi:hypothetical protein
MAPDPPLCKPRRQIRLQPTMPHPDLQAHRITAFGSGALPPWTPSCHYGGVGETLARGADRDGDGFGWRRGRAAGETLA